MQVTNYTLHCKQGSRDSWRSLDTACTRHTSDTGLVFMVDSVLVGFASFWDLLFNVWLIFAIISYSRALSTFYIWAYLQHNFKPHSLLQILWLKTENISLKSFLPNLQFLQLGCSAVRPAANAFTAELLHNNLRNIIKMLLAIKHNLQFGRFCQDWKLARVNFEMAK